MRDLLLLIVRVISSIFLLIEGAECTLNNLINNNIIYYKYIYYYNIINPITGLTSEYLTVILYCRMFSLLIFLKISFYLECEIKAITISIMDRNVQF